MRYICANCGFEGKPTWSSGSGRKPFCIYCGKEWKRKK